MLGWLPGSSEPGWESRGRVTLASSNPIVAALAFDLNVVLHRGIVLTQYGSCVMG